MESGMQMAKCFSLIFSLRFLIYSVAFDTLALPFFSLLLLFSSFLVYFFTFSLISSSLLISLKFSSSTSSSNIFLPQILKSYLKCYYLLTFSSSESSEISETSLLLFAQSLLVLFSISSSVWSSSMIVILGFFTILGSTLFFFSITFSLSVQTFSFLYFS